MMSGLKSTTAETSALSTANQPTVGNKNIGANSKDDKDSLWCNHCQKPRHTRDNCWKIHGRPAIYPRTLEKLVVGIKVVKDEAKPRATDQMTGNSSLFCSNTPLMGLKCKLTKDLNCIANFHPNHCVFKICVGKKIGSARRAHLEHLPFSHVSIPRDMHEAMRTFAPVAKMTLVKCDSSSCRFDDWPLHRRWISSVKKGIVLSQRKYVLDLLKETSMLGCKPIDTPIDVNIEMSTHIGEVRSKQLHARSSAEAEFKALALRIMELIWLKSLITKHAEIDQHFIKEKIEVRLINLSHVSLRNLYFCRPRGVKGNGWEDLRKAILSVQEYPDQVGGAQGEVGHTVVVAEDGFKMRYVVTVQDRTHEGKAIARMMAEIHFEEVGEGNEGGKGNFEAVGLDEVAVSVTGEDDEDDAVTSKTTRSEERVGEREVAPLTTKIAEGL
ncbi:hypothetical protein AAG906_016883 [Vitis piasezkii]